jgi:predicted RNase H-like HicB family nuclease
MSKRRVIIKTLKADKGYRATTVVNNNFIATQSETFEELKSTIPEALNLAFEDEGYQYSIKKKGTLWGVRS